MHCTPSLTKFKPKCLKGKKDHGDGDTARERRERERERGEIDRSQITGREKSLEEEEEEEACNSGVNLLYFMQKERQSKLHLAFQASLPFNTKIVVRYRVTHPSSVAVTRVHHHPLKIH